MTENIWGNWAITRINGVMGPLDYNWWRGPLRISTAGRLFQPEKWCQETTLQKERKTPAANLEPKFSNVRCKRFGFCHQISDHYQTNSESWSFPPHNFGNGRFLTAKEYGQNDSATADFLVVNSLVIKLVLWFSVSKFPRVPFTIVTIKMKHQLKLLNYIMLESLMFDGENDT